MISVGEESNQLEKVLLDTANALDKRTARQLELMIRLLEPVMLLVMAVVILIVVARAAAAGVQDEQCGAWLIVNRLQAKGLRANDSWFLNGTRWYTNRGYLGFGDKGVLLCCFARIQRVNDARRSH